MLVAVKGAEDAKTAIFPKTVKEARDGAFTEKAGNGSVLQSVVLNDGLERLGGCRSEDNNRHIGVFWNCKIKKIMLP